MITCHRGISDPGMLRRSIINTLPCHQHDWPDFPQEPSDLQTAARKPVACR